MENLFISLWMVLCLLGKGFYRCKWCKLFHTFVCVRVLHARQTCKQMETKNRWRFRWTKITQRGENNCHNCFEHQDELQSCASNMIAASCVHNNWNCRLTCCQRKSHLSIHPSLCFYSRSEEEAANVPSLQVKDQARFIAIPPPSIELFLRVSS